jgi:hypothetical protein
MTDQNQANATTTPEPTPENTQAPPPQGSPLPDVLITDELFAQILKKLQDDFHNKFMVFVMDLMKTPSNQMVFQLARTHFDTGYCVMKEAIASLPRKNLQQVPVAPTATQRAQQEAPQTAPDASALVTNEAQSQANDTQDDGDKLEPAS